MKIAFVLIAASLVLGGCVAGARYKGAARSAAPEATAPSPFGRNIDRGVPVFTDHVGDSKPGQQ